MIAVAVFVSAAIAAAPCSLVDPKYSAQYLTYDHHGEAQPSYGDESNEHVWLRLHNNTSCRIKIAAGMPIAIRDLPDGRRTIDPKDRQEVWMEVQITDPRSGALAYPHDAVGARTPVPAAQSVTFRIPANFLKRGPISVPFDYEWDSAGMGFGRVEHRLVYDPRDLPDDVLAWLESVKDPPERPVLSPSHPGRRLSRAPAHPGPGPSPKP